MGLQIYKIGSWEWLEERIMSEHRYVSLASMWYCPKPPTALDSVIIRFSCSIVKMMRRRFGVKGLSLPSCPMWHNPLFTAGENTLNNRLWHSHGISSIGQIVKDDILHFSQVKADLGLSDTYSLRQSYVRFVKRRMLNLTLVQS